jgi:hypothetical protein
MKAGSYKLPDVPDFKPARRSENITALEHIVHSLAQIASHPKKTKNGVAYNQSYVAVPMSPKLYGADGRYSHISSSAIRDMIGALCRFGASDVRPAWLTFSPARPIVEEGSIVAGVSSGVRPNTAFMDWLTQRGLVFYLHPNGKIHKTSNNDGSYLRLNTKLKEHPTDESGEEEKSVKLLARALEADELILPELNRLLKKQVITVQLSGHADYMRHWNHLENNSRLAIGGNKAIYRQFSGKDGWGGRLYGHYVQQLPKEARKLLKIDGQPTAERDYSSMQLRLLYARAGLPLPIEGDLYTHPDYPMMNNGGYGGHRELMKAVLTRSVGNATKAETIKSMIKFLKDEGWIISKVRAEEAYHEFWDMHPDVCPHDSDTAAWSWLQYLDSQIALRVLSKLLEQGIVGIPIHDSFIVQDRHAKQLEVAMIESFAEFAPGVDCHIS